MGIDHSPAKSYTLESVGLLRHLDAVPPHPCTSDTPRSVFHPFDVQEVRDVRPHEAVHFERKPATEQRSVPRTSRNSRIISQEG